ncbi:MAG: hypothetical protein ACRDNJ_15735 [Solirubrobacteraceae bacterium]
MDTAMILLAGVLFTVVIWWLVVVLLGGLLGLAARPVLRRMRAGWRRRRARRAERVTPARGPRVRDSLPDPSSDWWPEFERQFRAHVRLNHDAPHRPGTRRPGPDRPGR